MSVKNNLALQALTLGVVTPQARERTALEKHSGSDARTVVYAKFLYIKNHSLSHFKNPLTFGVFNIPFYRGFVKLLVEVS
jgi:hypothetical protein